MNRGSPRLTVKHAVDTKLPNTEQPDFPVLEGFHHVRLAEELGAGRVAVFPGMPHFHHLLFVGIEEVGRLGVVGEQEEGGDTKKKGRYALYDHDPLQGVSRTSPQCLVYLDK